MLLVIKVKIILKNKKILGDDSDVSFVRTERNPLSFRNYLGYKDLAAIIDRGNYDLIWTNEPVMSVMTRLAARKTRKKNHTKLLYLVHGFHFFKGAPKINWIVYPIEKFMARYCDAMTMINWEDYHFTQNTLVMSLYIILMELVWMLLNSQRFKLILIVNV